MNRPEIISHCVGLYFRFSLQLGGDDGQARSYSCLMRLPDRIWREIPEPISS
jgi:hypothetical protein